MTHERRRRQYREEERARQAARNLANAEQALEGSKTLSEILSDDKAKARIHDRATRILNPHKDLPPLENLARELVVARTVYKKKRPTSKKLKQEEEDDAKRLADDGIALLEKNYGDDETTKRLVTVKPFKDLRIASTLRALRPDQKRQLALVKLVVEDFSAQYHEDNLGLFAAAIGYAQRAIADQDEGLNRRDRHAKRDEILYYGVQIVIINGQQELLRHILKLGEKKRKEPPPDERKFLQILFKR